MNASSCNRPAVPTTAREMFVGISAGKFDELVSDGRMPPPRRIDGRRVWDIRSLDVAFDRLPEEDSPATGTGWEDA